MRMRAEWSDKVAKWGKSDPGKSVVPSCYIRVMGLRTVRGVSVDEALRMVLLLPEVDQRQHGNHLGFRIRDRAFAYLCADDLTMLVKATREEQAALVEDDPRAYKKARASGRIGWVQVRLRKAHEDELADLITEAWRMTAPRLIVARADLPLC
nr:hypothetical protein GCM10020063_063360 [Dactylosporangium thailandense]